MQIILLAVGFFASSRIINVFWVFTHTGSWLEITDVAVKTLKQGSMTKEAFLEEAKIMNRLRHRKLVMLLGVCTASEPIYIITELMSNGALLDYLRQDSGRTLNISIIIDMAAQVGDLHNISCLH